MLPHRRALLDAIASNESGGDYNIIYGGSRFDDYSQHPARYVTIKSGPNKGQKSSAAGRYQFLKSTWDEAQRALNLPDFSPASQDAAAWWLADRDYRRRTGRDLDTDLRNSKNLPKIGRVLSKTWTSLPSGIERTHTGESFANAYRASSQTPAEMAADYMGTSTPFTNRVGDSSIRGGTGGSSVGGTGTDRLQPAPIPTPRPDRLPSVGGLAGDPEGTPNALSALNPFREYERSRGMEGPSSLVWERDPMTGRRPGGEPQNNRGRLAAEEAIREPAPMPPPKPPQNFTVSPSQPMGPPPSPQEMRGPSPMPQPTPQEIRGPSQMPQPTPQEMRGPSPSPMMTPLQMRGYPPSPKIGPFDMRGNPDPQQMRQIAIKKVADGLKGAVAQ